MIEASTVRRIQAKKAEELHIQLCAKIAQGIENAAMNSFTELRVQLSSEIQHAHPSSILLEDYAYDIERLQLVLDDAGYEVHNTYKNSFMIKW